MAHRDPALELMLMRIAGLEKQSQAQQRHIEALSRALAAAAEVPGCQVLSPQPPVSSLTGFPPASHPERIPADLAVTDEDLALDDLFGDLWPGGDYDRVKAEAGKPWEAGQ